MFLQEIIINILNISKTKISISKFNISVDGNYNLGKIDKKDKLLFTIFFIYVFLLIMKTSKFLMSGNFASYNETKISKIGD